MNHLVFADPSNTAARQLQANALEQLGYQSESAAWRNAYLTGAMELREGSPELGRIPPRDMSGSMRPDHIFDIIGVRFDPAGFTRAPTTINVRFTDLGEDHVLGLGRSAVYHRPDSIDEDAAATVHADRAKLHAALNDPAAVAQFEIDGDEAIVYELFACLTVFTPPAIIEP